MMKKKLVLMIVSILLLSGCDKNQIEEGNYDVCVFTEKYYERNGELHEVDEEFDHIFYDVKIEYKDSETFGRSYFLSWIDNGLAQIDSFFVDRVESNCYTTNEFNTLIKESEYVELSTYEGYSLEKITTINIKSNRGNDLFHLGASNPDSLVESCSPVMDLQGNQLYDENGDPIQECYIDLIFGGTYYLEYDKDITQILYRFIYEDRVMYFNTGLAQIPKKVLVELLMNSDEFHIIESILE